MPDRNRPDPPEWAMQRARELIGQVQAMTVPFDPEEVIARALVAVRRETFDRAMRACEGPGNQWDAQQRIRALADRELSK